MSQHSNFGQALGAGLTFGFALSAAKHISEQSATLHDQVATIQRLVREYNELVDRFNELLKQRNDALRERDRYKCGVKARRLETAHLLGLLRQAYGWGSNSSAEAELVQQLEKISTDAFVNEMRQLGYKFEGD